MPLGSEKDSDGDGVPDCNDPDHTHYKNKGAYLPPSGRYRAGGGGCDDNDNGVLNLNDPSSPCYTLPGGLGYESTHIKKIRTPFKTVYLAKGDRFTLPLAHDGERGRLVEKDPGAKFSSSEAKVAKVSTKGMIKAMGKGKAVIKVTSTSGKTMKVKVVVSEKRTKDTGKIIVKKPKSLLNKSKAWVIKSGRAAVVKIAQETKKATNVTVTFASSRPNVLKVDKAGKLWALKKGKSILTVKTKQKNGKTTLFKKTIITG
jgi:hypothetical protein